MQNLTIYDMNNYFRRRAEVDTFGTPVRSCFQEIQNQPGLVICCWDGFNALKARRDIYPEYKSKRLKASESIYESQNLLRKLLNFSKAIQVSIEGYEADDVIAALTYKYENQCSIFVHSNDLDLYQLGKPMARDTFPDKPQWIKLYKTLVGDSSDNIPGAQGFGKLTWAKLSEQDKEVLEAIITSGWGLTEDNIRARLINMLPTKLVNYLSNKDNLKTLLIYYKIIGFVSISEELIVENMTAGVNRPDLAEPIFQQFML